MPMKLSYQFIFCFFFFSSRRRHTRCSRDWSSDVCSSDLAPPGDGQAHGGRPRRRARAHRRERLPGKSRSEERRVGKECRSERSTDYYIDIENVTIYSATTKITSTYIYLPDTNNGCP